MIGLSQRLREASLRVPIELRPLLLDAAIDLEEYSGHIALLAAASALAPHLSTSTDPPKPVLAIMMTPAMGLRQAALDIEQRDEAIRYFRKALAALGEDV